jgi:hypothetical protein
VFTALPQAAIRNLRSNPAPVAPPSERRIPFRELLRAINAAYREGYEP